jgi:hypothetical protein
VQHHWFAHIGHNNAAAIRHLIVDCEGKIKHADNTMVQLQNTLAKRCPNLTTIRYRLLFGSNIWRDGPEMMVNHKIAGSWAKIRKLNEIVVEARGGHWDEGSVRNNPINPIRTPRLNWIEPPQD